MIENALALLDMHDLPTWEADAPLRREMERLEEDLKPYRVAAGCDVAKARRVADQVNERADRIRAFLKGRRCGAQHHNGYGFRSAL